MIKTISRFKMLLFLVVMAVLCSATDMMAQDVTYITPDQLSPTATTAFKIEADGIYVLAAINEGTGLPDPAAAPTTFDGFIQIIKGKNVTLYLNGHTLTCSKSKKIIESKGNLTLYGTYPGGNEGGIIDGYNATNSSIKNCAISQATAGMSTVIDGITIQNCNYGSAGGAINNVSGTGTLQISNTTIKDCKSSGNGGAIYCDNTASVTIDNVTIQRCSGTGGGAIYKYHKSELMTVSNSLIEDCTASSHGGGIYFTNYTAGLEITNTTIRNCESKGNGGGIYSAGLGIVTFKNGSIISNCAALNNKGGGIYIGGSGKLTMEDGSLIQQCFANTGGGVYVATSGIFTMDGGTIEYCYAVKDRETDFVKDGDPAGEGYVGGGVCMNSSTMNFNGGVIQYCHAGTGSGGIHTWYGDARAYLYINDPTCKVTHCDAYSYAGCTHVGNGSYCVMKDGEISYNTCQNGSLNENGGAFSVGFATGCRFDIEGGKICHNQALAEDGGIGLGGGIFMRQSGSAGGAINITGGEISDNYAANKGGGVYARISVKVDGASILRNEAGVDGGGIFFESTCSYFKFLSGEISGNTAGNNGGGLYFDNFGSNSIELIQGTLADNTAGNYGGGAYMVNSKITFGTGTDLVSFEGNSAVQGGGLYISSTGSAIRNVTINNSSFKENTASNCGGGIYLADNGKGALYLKQGGTYSQNTATNDGGAIFVNNIKAVEMESGEFSCNEAIGNGGAMYVGTGTITLTSGSASENIAYNGGAFYADGGSVNIDGGYQISNNVANHDGAGLYANGGNVEIKGGIINENKALAGNGGAFFLSPDAKIILQDGSIEKNEATNGGAIYLSGGAYFEYITSATGDLGYIRGNRASNLGGGIYLAEGTSQKTEMKFNLNSPTLGFYDNIAEVGADDIYAYGEGTTTINIPNVQSMNLGGYSIPGATLEWWEDYKVNDSRYSEGTLQGDPSNIARFRASRDANLPIWKVPKVSTTPLSNFYEKYLCLTFNFEYGKIEIRRAGLKPNENAIYEVKFGDGSQREIQRVVVNGSDEEGIDVGGKHWNVANVSFLPKGEYTVTEIPWTWYNDYKEASDLSKTQIISEGDGYIFNFDNTHHDMTETPLHDEEFKVNKLKH